jgi:hypothetical protein
MLSERSLSSSRMTDGVTPGVYRVSISAARVTDEDADEVEWLAPSQYADFRTSGIEMRIDRPQDDLVLDLVSEPTDATDTTEDETRRIVPTTPQNMVEREILPE